MVCLAALVCGVINNILEPTKQASSKKTKRKQKSGVSQASTGPIKIFLIIICNACCNSSIFNLFFSLFFFQDSQSPEIVEAHNKFMSEVLEIATELHLALGNLRLRISVEAYHSQMPSMAANVGNQGAACRVPAVGTLPTIGPDDVSALSTGMAQLVLSYENRKNKDKGYSVDVSAKLSESYEDSLQAIITVLQQKMTYLDSTKL